MKISKNKFVSVSYELHVGENDELELMEATTPERPLDFIFGTGAMLPAFEDRLNGLQSGNEFRFSIPPEDAYGEFIKEHLIEVPKETFMIDGRFDGERVVEGATLPMYNDRGERLNGSVVEIADTHVLMDFNHPLAGETLHFNGTILSVREATEQELIEFNRVMEAGCGCGCNCECECECGTDCESGSDKGGCAGCHCGDH